MGCACATIKVSVNKINVSSWFKINVIKPLLEIVVWPMLFPLIFADV